jgi:hypothetical protein
MNASQFRKIADQYRVRHVFILTFWSDRQRGITEVFYTLEQAQKFSRRKKWKKMGEQWFCETTLGIYRIRHKPIRGRAPWVIPAKSSRTSSTASTK